MPQSNHHPHQPCPSCGGLTFAILPDIGTRLLAVDADGQGWKDVVRPFGFDASVCMDCGRTEFHATHLDQVLEKVPGAYGVTVPG